MEVAQDAVGRGNVTLLEQSAFKIKLLTGLILAVCAIVLIAHWPALSAGALSFDDNVYLAQNILVQNPGLKSAWEFLSEVLEPSTVRGYYQPLTMISLMIDYALGGRPDNLRQFHRTSLTLHLMNTALIIVLLYMLFDHPWIAAAVGLLFGVHPITVEPIPWIGERKTLLAAFFALWCLIFYVRFVRKGGWKSYVTCFIMYFLALMSKPTSTPLPALLLLMDYWPLRRFKWRAVLEKLPFFALGGIFAVITYVSQTRTAGTTSPVTFGPERVPLILCHNIIFYLYKIAWPVNLSSHYPFPRPLDWSVPMVRAGIIGTCILIPLLLISLRWTRAVFTGWLFFFVAIFPTMGVIGFSNVIASDKFAYLPSMGLLMVLASFLVWLCVRDGVTEPAILRVVVVIVLVLAAFETAATRRYLVHWRNSVSLFEYMLKLTPQAESIHDALGNALQVEGRLDEAISQFHQALQIKSDVSATHYNLANTLKLQGKIDEAIDSYQRALQLRPNDPEVHNNLGIALMAKGRVDEAVSHFNKALRIKPKSDLAHFNLAVIFDTQGKLDEAISHYRQVLELRPKDAETHSRLGVVLQVQNRLDEAIKHFRKALKSRPGDAATHYNLGLALAMTNQPQDAIKHFQQSLRQKPDWIPPLIWLARVLSTYPDFAVHNLKQAIEAAERAAKLTNYKDAEVLEVLAAAYDAAGQFSRAVATAQTALELAVAAKDDDLANYIRQRIKLYKQAESPQGSMTGQDANRP